MRLIVYRAIDVALPLSGGRRLRFRHELTPREAEAAVASFLRLPALARELSEGSARVEAAAAEATSALTSLTAVGPDFFWPSPDDTRAELRRLPSGAVDSVLVLWPQREAATGRSVPSGGWGLAIGAGPWSGGPTYATVGNAEPAVFERRVGDEVWLHEWLHGVCDLYRHRGFPMPEGDADGGSRHGYLESPAEGWSAYYHDLMTGRVEAGGRTLGIHPAAWQTGALAGARPAARDHISPG